MASNSNLYNKITLNPANRGQQIVPKMYKGFSTVSSSTENFNLYDFQLIQQDILNHFYTRQGERVMNPTFGCIIWDLLFEPLTDNVKKLITDNVDNILNHDPRISASRVTVTQYESGIQIECLLTYMPYNISQAMKLQFDQKNGLLVT